ncbi:MAG: T9SS type A sorting domain-containing protein [Bacteroidia bacterium]
MKNLLFLFTFLGYLASLQAQDPFLFEEQNGLVVIETASAPDYGNWSLDTAILGFTGENYLVYQGANLYNSPGSSRLEYKVQINKAGKYRLQWRSRITIGSSNTDHNDSWLRINDASKFYAQKSANVLYPYGSGMTPNPEGAGKNGWFKVYQNVLNNWTWNTSTNDNNPHSIFVEFDSIGIYTIEVSGRSAGHAIDRIVLYHSDLSANQALDINLAESPKSVLSSISKEIINFNVFPNPAKDYVTLSIPTSLPSSLRSLKIMDISGRLVKEITQHLSAQEKLIIPLTDIASGLYFLMLETEETIYRAKFAKN